MAMHGQGGPLDYKNYGRQGRRQQKKASGRRVWFWLCLLLLFCAGLYWLLRPGPEVAKEQGAGSQEVEKKAEVVLRNKIYDRNLQTLALSFPVYAALVKPLELESVSRAAQEIGAVLGEDQAMLERRLRSQRTFVWLSKTIAAEQAKRLVALEMKGLYLRQAAVRYYPHFNAAAQVLGYVQDNHGLSGVEYYYDDELLGSQQTAHQHDDDQQQTKAKHVVLTIDLHVQTILEKHMALLAAQTHASSVSALAVDPASGAIVAYAQQPSFDPNAFWLAQSRDQQVKAVATLLDPGAISGLFRLGAAYMAHHDMEPPAVESPPRVIRPRTVKIGSTSHGGHWWLWPQGGYISDELGELADPSVGEDELLAFQQALGISCADAIDLPEKVVDLRLSDRCGQGYLNGISLLGGFSRLINGGHPVQLHVKFGSLDDEGHFERAAYSAKGSELGEVSSSLLRALHASAGEDAKFLAVEYLAPLAEEGMIVAENLEQESESENYDGLLLAAGPGVQPQLALLIHVENGQFDRHDASPMRQWAGRFFSSMNKEGLPFASTELPAELP